MAAPDSPDAPTTAAGDAPAYAELWCRSHFSFLHGASHPEELVERAHALGYQALALTDECSVAGVVRAHQKAKALGLSLIIGAQFQWHEDPAVAQDEGNLSPVPSPAPSPAHPSHGLAVELLARLRQPRPPEGSAEGSAEGPAEGPPEGPSVAPPQEPASAPPPEQAPDVAVAAKASAWPQAGTRHDTLVVLARNLQGYGNLCQFITRLKRQSPKGTYTLNRADVQGHELADCLVLLAPDRRRSLTELKGLARWLQRHFMGRCALAFTRLAQLDDACVHERLQHLSLSEHIPLCAAGDVLMHRRSRKPLQDVLTAIRLGRTVSECGWWLQANGERHLRPRERLAQCYPPALLQASVALAQRCQFSLDELRYQYPDEVVPPGLTATQHLRSLVLQGAEARWPGGPPPHVRELIEHELALIADLRYEHYFLTVHDIVAFARSRQILCQGRGSAANSVVCFCLGITEIDPARMNVLFERFISRERNEPPDIDVDFEHQRREEVIQYLYAKYGRDRAALTATVIAYRPKSALRDVGKAMGLSDELIERVARHHGGWDLHALSSERLREIGVPVDDLRIRQYLELAGTLMGFPRHLSQHTGGFVLTRTLLSRMVPVTNAAMPDRTVIEWDKDDLDAMGLMKVDVLALGMLTALSSSLQWVRQMRQWPRFGLKDIPEGCPHTYEMCSQADTVGVFQIESRAQMSMLPRLQPRRFYDLVIEVAIVRPGPIQGGMVHPYLNRRLKIEPETYPSEALKAALGRTLGVPIFQEQVMQVCMIAAGFSPGEADGLRRAMAAWKRKGGLEKYRARILQGMQERGYEEAFAEQIYEQIKGFSDYGFPESHAASFALLAYASAWMKCHEPAAFLVALLNAQPMGFYSPDQLVRDARRHGLLVRPVDVCESQVGSHLELQAPLQDWVRVPLPLPPEPWRDHPLFSREGLTHPQPPLRLGLHLIRGLPLQAMARIVQAREEAPFQSAEDLALRAALSREEMVLLAQADALASLSGHRRQQVWEASAQRRRPGLLQEAPIHEAPLTLPEAPLGEAVVADLQRLGLSLKAHPLSLLREALQGRRLMSSQQLQACPDRRFVRVAGLVTLRQQPETAKGTVFVTLEDEFGCVQVIVWKRVRDQYRLVLRESRLLAVYGQWQREGQVGHLIAGHLANLNELLAGLDGMDGPGMPTPSRDYR